MTATAQFISVVGPTGSGKSSLAVSICLALAERGVRAEVVNADAMQFYKGMDIGTAKLSNEERQGIPHHLLDWLEVTEESTAANYQKLAREKISELQSASILPVVVGGSMLYLAALINTFEFPGRDEDLRADLESELIAFGPERMHEKLASLDPVAASRIEPKNGRRIVRALEIVMITGSPFAAALPDQFVSYAPNLQIGLNSDRENLLGRIKLRVEKMWELGLISEVEMLIDKGIRDSKTARQAIGYAQALKEIEGMASRQEAIDETIMLTNRYSRRQMSWFRRDPRIQWLDYQTDNLLDSALDKVFRAIEG